MRGAGAIGGAKAGQWKLRAGLGGDALRPEMFQARRRRLKPDGRQFRRTAQIVNMPVRAGGKAEVMIDPPAQPARP